MYVFFDCFVCGFMCFVVFCWSDLVDFDKLSLVDFDRDNKD